LELGALDDGVDDVRAAVQRLRGPEALALERVRNLSTRALRAVSTRRSSSLRRAPPHRLPRTMDLKKLLQKPLIAVRLRGESAALSCPRLTRLPAPRAPQKDDMPTEMAAEAVEIVTAAVDKYLATENYEVRRARVRAPPMRPRRALRRALCAGLSASSRPAPFSLPSQKAAQAVKEALDKKFGPSWQCCVGEGFGFDVTYNSRNMLLVYYGEKLGILIFKC
jgi:dynein light chain 4